MNLGGCVVIKVLDKPGTSNVTALHTTCRRWQWTLSPFEIATVDARNSRTREPRMAWILLARNAAMTDTAQVRHRVKNFERVPRHLSKKTFQGNEPPAVKLNQMEQVCLVSRLEVRIQVQGQWRRPSVLKSERLPRFRLQTVALHCSMWTRAIDTSRNEIFLYSLSRSKILFIISLYKENVILFRNSLEKRSRI